MSEWSEIHRNRQVADFSGFCEGDLEPSLNKRIDSLIEAQREFIVYLDEDQYVMWSIIPGSSKLSVPKSGEVLNRVALLESDSIGLMKGENLERFRRLLGESVARLL